MRQIISLTETKANLSKTPKLQSIAFLIAIMMVLSGCGQSYSAKPLSAVKQFRQSLTNTLNSPNPSENTQQYLRIKFLDKQYRDDPEAVILKLLELSRQTQDPDARTATAELALLQARNTFKKDQDVSAAMYLTAAEIAYDYLLTDTSLKANALKPSYRFMADIYNRSISRLVEIREKRGNPWTGSSTGEAFGTKYEFSTKTSGQDIWDPDMFDSFRPTNQIQVGGFKNRYKMHGLGAPLVGFIDKPREHPDLGKYHPQRGVAYPVTALLEFEPIRTNNKTRKAQIVFYDSLATDTAIIAGKNIPLEADFSTPLGVLMAKMQPQKFGITGLLNSDVYIENAGMYMLEPYRPNKIPVILVHGLMSSPETWIGMFNDLRGDSELRDNYQFWFYMYPTGLPIIYSGSLLRETLLDIRTKYDPQGTNEYFNNAVLIGHSMGGLLSRLIVQNSENVYWDSVFAKPLDSISVDEDTRSLLKKLFFFEKVPFIKRAVFIATPHRGSDLADQWFAKIGSGMVNLPTLVTDIGDSIFNLKQEELAIDPKEFSKKVPNSIDLLSPSSNFLQTTITVPLSPSIPYHSIIGVRHDVQGPGSSDGIVPYESSHLDNVVSEKLIPYGHEAQRHPLAIDEVKRILKLHLK
jgi:pimeloyl-ACP methyl ester carboxylesterase